MAKKYDREWILKNLEAARPNTIYRSLGAKRNLTVFSRKKLSEINRPVSSSTPESEPIKKTIETYVNKSRKLYPNERRAREIQKLITFDSRLGSHKSANTVQCHLETSKFLIR